MVLRFKVDAGVAFMAWDEQDAGDNTPCRFVTITSGDWSLKLAQLDTRTKLISASWMYHESVIRSVSSTTPSVDWADFILAEVVARPSQAPEPLWILLESLTLAPECVEFARVDVLPDRHPDYLNGGRKSAIEDFYG